MRSFCASRDTGASPHAPVGPIGRRRKAKSSVRCGTCAGMSSTGGRFSMTPISISSGRAGWSVSRMSACTRRRASGRVTASIAKSGSCCSHWRRGRTRRWCSTERRRRRGVRRGPSSPSKNDRSPRMRSSPAVWHEERPFVPTRPAPTDARGSPHAWWLGSARCHSAGRRRRHADSPRRLKVLTHPAVLVVDEIWYLPRSRTGAMLFVQLMTRRYERASTVLTSNKGLEDWGEVFGDEVMAAALIDRLVHHCHLVTIRGNSYRIRQHAEVWQVLQAPQDPAPPARRQRTRQEAATT